MGNLKSNPYCDKLEINEKERGYEEAKLFSKMVRMVNLYRGHRSCWLVHSVEFIHALVATASGSKLR